MYLHNHMICQLDNKQMRVISIIIFKGYFYMNIQRLYLYEYSKVISI